MNWITIVWPMVAAVCLTLALIELRIGVTPPVEWARLMFSWCALLTAVACGIELSMMRAQRPDQLDTLLRWGDLTSFLMLTSLTAFVWIYFRSGNRWLALAGPCLYAVGLPFDMPPGSSLVYLRVTGIETMHTFGGASFQVAVGQPNPWNILAYLATLMMLIFVGDAALRLARRGETRRAWIIGGSILFWGLICGIQSALIESGLIRMPYTVSVVFLGVVLAMSFELTRDVSAAAKLGMELRDSQQRLDLATQAASLGMWTWNLSTHEAWVSTRVRALLGLGESEHVRFEQIIEAVHPDDRDAVREAVDRSVAERRDLEIEHRIQSPSSDQRWISLRGQLERNTAGETTNVMRGVLFDISARRQSELEMHRLRGELAHTSRVSMLGQLTTALAHELHQPLGAILRNAEAAELFLEQEPLNLGVAGHPCRYSSR